MITIYIHRFFPFIMYNVHAHGYEKMNPYGRYMNRIAKTSLVKNRPISGSFRADDF